MDLGGCFGYTPGMINEGINVMWFYRNGSEVSEANLPLIVKGKAGFSGFIQKRGPCSRCGGAGGSRSWFPDGGICYRCRGHNSQTFETIVSRVFTADRLAVLVAAADKKAAKLAAKAATKAEAARQEFIVWAKAGGRGRGALIGHLLTAGNPQKDGFVHDLARKLRQRWTLSDKQLAAAERVFEQQAERKVTDAASEWIGEVKVRMEIEVKVLFIKEHEGYYGPVDIIKMQDMEGNGLTWFCTGISSLKRGDHVKIKATVKKHEEYQGAKQTVLTRCTVLETYTTMTPDEAANLEQVA